ncbi:MAG: hypothetical protein ABSC47_11720 [Terracidiphilus sp.]|jgi:hypothetical protein
MTDSGQPVLERMIRECSRLLLWVGAAVFLLGDAFLYEIKHVNFFVSAATGILGGVLVMLLGAGIAVTGKSPRPGQNCD